MVQSFQFDSQEPLSLAEYVDKVQNEVDVVDSESLVGSAELLYRLSLDRTLLHPLFKFLDYSQNDLVQGDNFYNDSTFILARPPNANFFVRTNIWKVPKARGGQIDGEKNLYSYDMPHDHNFDFLTVGYLGPGYTTKLYEYDNSSIEGYEGEPVALEYRGETMLPTGKVMYYRKSFDVHAQKPPERLSVSINLMVSGGDQSRRQQFFFDTDNSRIHKFTDGVISDRVSLVDLAGLLDSNAIDPLLTLARKHPCPRTRSQAARSVLQIDPSTRSFLQEALREDRNALVTRVLHGEPEAVFA